MSGNIWKKTPAVLEIIEKFSFSSNLLCLTNTDGIIIYVNPAWEKCLGRKRESFLGKELLSFTHTQDISKTKENLKLAYTTKVESFENRIHHQNGEVRYLKWTSIPDQTEGIIISIGTDVTTEKTAQHQMHNFYNALTDMAIVSVTDQHGIIIEVNDTFCQISGYSREELIGQNHRILNSNFHDNTFFRQLWSTILEKKTWRGEVCNMKKDGSLYWVDSFVMALTNIEGQIVKFISIRYDITDKKAAEEIMIHNARLLTLGEMSASLAHEIKNPLSIIKLAAEDLKESLEKEHISKNELMLNSKHIDNAVSRIVKIIQGLQSYARNSDRGQMEIMSTAEILDETMVFSDYRIKTHGVKFVSEILPEIYLNARPSQISQILINLINNAIDACLNSEEKSVTLSMYQENSMIYFSVVNSGPKITDDIAQHIMEPFFTTKESSKGTGLGLSLSRKLAHDHGGNLFYDQKNHQTRFVLELPLAAPLQFKKTS